VRVALTSIAWTCGTGLELVAEWGLNLVLLGDGFETRLSRSRRTCSRRTLPRVILLRPCLGDLNREPHVATSHKRRYQVTARDIRQFAQAVGEPWPAPEDRTDHDGRGPRAPLLFCQSYMYDEVDPTELAEDGSPKELVADIPRGRIVGGGSDFEILEPVYEGDWLTVLSTQREVFDKEGRSGRLYFVVVETVFTNQRNQMVAREVATYISR
jgi:MaoC dehydratase-like protein